MNGETPMSAEPQRKPTLDNETIAESVAASAWQQGVLDLPGPFRLESGQTLENAHLAWQCAGPADAPLVIALGGISAHRRPCSAEGNGWWESQCGAGKTLDTREDRFEDIAIEAFRAGVAPEPGPMDFNPWGNENVL